MTPQNSPMWDAGVHSDYRKCHFPEQELSNEEVIDLLQYLDYVLAAESACRDGLRDFAQVVPQMPPVGNMDGLRSRKACRLGVALSAIATEDGDLRVGAQPGSGCRGAGVVEQIHHSVSLQIDHNGAALMASAQGEIVDADDGELRWSAAACGG